MVQEKISKNQMIKSRSLSWKGIEVHAIYYNCNELLALRAKIGNQKVRFIYDPYDISAIYVRDRPNQSWIYVPATNQEYAKDMNLLNHKKNLASIQQLREQEKISVQKRQKKLYKNTLGISYQRKENTHDF